jgi:hypothetical protein
MKQNTSNDDSKKYTRTRASYGFTVGASPPHKSKQTQYWQQCMFPDNNKRWHHLHIKASKPNIAANIVNNACFLTIIKGGNT